MGFSRQEYRNGFPSPGDLPNPGIESTSPALQADSLPLSHQGSTCLILLRLQHPKSDWQTKHAGGVLHHGEAIGEWTEECFLGDSVVKNPPANAGDARHMGFNLGSWRSPGVKNGNQLQYSCLGNPMDRGDWRGYSLWGCKEVGHNRATEHAQTEKWTATLS